MRKLITRFSALGAALAALLLIVPAQPVGAQVSPTTPQISVAGFATAVNGSTAATPCMLVKYVGTSTGKPTVEVAALGDITFKIAAAADTTTGSPSLNGIFTTADAATNTLGKLVNVINTTGSNWRAVLTGCLSADLRDNTIDTLAATDAAAPGGVVLFKDAVVASATAVFSAQVALYPGTAATDIRFHLSGKPIGATTGSTSVNPNPLGRYQTFVTHALEKITSTGVIAQFEILGVKRTYDSTGKVSETVRTLYAETGAATTVEKSKDFFNSPIPADPGELVIVRQRTATDLTAQSVNGVGYAVRKR